MKKFLFLVVSASILVSTTPAMARQAIRINEVKADAMLENTETCRKKEKVKGIRLYRCDYKSRVTECFLAQPVSKYRAGCFVAFTLRARVWVIGRKFDVRCHTTITYTKYPDNEVKRDPVRYECKGIG